MMLERMDPDIAGLLMPGEEILLVASQSKVAPGGSISSPDRIYITTTRVLFKDPKMFGLRANIIAVKYEEIATVMLKRGVFSTEILLKPRASLQHIDLPAVDKQVALRVSSLIQKGMRGELASRKAAPPSRQESLPEIKPELEKPKIDALDRLERLALMKHQGMITEEEFDILKEELMLGIRPQISGETLASMQPPKLEQKKIIIEPPKPAAQEAEKPDEEEKEQAIACRYCGFASVPQAAKFCQDCGKDLKAETNVWKMCPACDSLTTNDAAFCSACRQKFPETLS
jgi:hypothetical protein